MRIALLHLAPLYRDSSDASRTAQADSPLGATDSHASDPHAAERAVSLGRALARRGHEVHLLAYGYEVPGAMRPATVHTWQAFGAPASLAASRAPFNIHLVRPDAAFVVDAESDFAARFAAAVQPDVVLAGLCPADAPLALAVAVEADAPMALRIPPIGALDCDEPALAGALGRARLVLAPSETARRQFAARLAAAGAAPPCETVTCGEGVDAEALAPEPRGALPALPTPPLPVGLRCVLFDGNADVDPLGRALLEASAGFLARRLDLALALPTIGLLASEVRLRGTPSRSRVVTVDPRDRASRDALVRYARLVVLGDAPCERSALRVLRCIARGVLPMARPRGALGEALSVLARHLPNELMEALVLPLEEDLRAEDLRQRVTSVLEHAEISYLAPRLAALAAREFDWSVRAHALEPLLERLRDERAVTR